jgi:hypothetical protein
MILALRARIHDHSWPAISAVQISRIVERLLGSTVVREPGHRALITIARAGTVAPSRYILRDHRETVTRLTKVRLTVLAMRRERLESVTSSVLERHRLRLIEHLRRETARDATGRLAAPQGVSPAITPLTPPPMVARSRERVTPAPGVREAQAEPLPPAHPVAEHRAPEVNVEHLADQVLWRIERRVIAQRERLGKA